MKRGQLTIFIIIGLLIFSSTLILIQTSKYVKNNVVNLDYNVGNYIQTCLEEVGDEAIEHSLFQSGFYYNGAVFDDTPHFLKLAEPISKTGPKQINYTFLKFSGRNIEFSLKSYFRDNVHSCMKNLTDFPSNVKYEGNGLIDATVGDKVIGFELRYPTTIKYDNDTVLLEDFRYVKEIDIGRMIDIVNQIVDESVETNDVPVDTIKSIMEENPNLTMHVSFLDLEEPISEIAAGDTMLGTIIYFLNFEENKTVAFTIEYDVLRLI